MTRGHNCQTDIAAMHVTKCQDYKAVAPCDDSVGMEIHDEKLIAEALGTFILVFFGCGSAVFTGADIGLMGIGRPDIGLLICKQRHYRHGQEMGRPRRSL